MLQDGPVILKLMSHLYGQHMTPEALPEKKLRFKHRLTADEFRFQYAVIHGWNILPNNNQF